MWFDHSVIQDLRGTGQHCSWMSVSPLSQNRVRGGKLHQSGLSVHNTDCVGMRITVRYFRQVNLSHRDTYLCSHLVQGSWKLAEVPALLQLFSYMLAMPQNMLCSTRDSQKELD